MKQRDPHKQQKTDGWIKYNTMKSFIYANTKKQRASQRLEAQMGPAETASSMQSTVTTIALFFYISIMFPGIPQPYKKNFSAYSKIKTVRYRELGSSGPYKGHLPLNCDGFFRIQTAIFTVSGKLQVVTGKPPSEYCWLDAVLHHQ